MEAALQIAREKGDRHPRAGSQGSGTRELISHPLLSLQQQAGNQAVQSLLRSGLIQAKLAVSQPGDPDEREADQVAERVMRMPAPRISSFTTAPVLHRKCSTCEEEEQKLARKGTGESATEGATLPPAIVHQVLGSSGQPLDTATRAFFEPRFGHDFSKVRVHTDERAGQSAQAVQASAYTVGQHIVFAPAQYAPATQKGMQLLAHELTHTRQQGNVGPTSPRAVQTLPMDDRGGNVEQEADRTSSSMVETEKPAVAGQNTNAQGAGALPLISRSVAPGTVQRAVPTGITLKETHPVGHANLRTEENKKKFLTYIADVSLMQLTPPGDYTPERQKGECTKEFLTEVSNTCPAAPTPFCTGDRCFQVNQYQSPVGDPNTGTMVADGPDTFVDFHRQPQEKSLLEGSGKNQCSVVCHQMYRYRTEPDKKYHDLGAFYIIRNFRADKFTPAGGTTPINITTGEIRKIPAGSSVPSRDDFAKNIAPGLAQSGALLDAPRITRVPSEGSSVDAAHGGEPTPARAETRPLILQQQAGNQTVQSLLRSGLIRAKLAISNPSDPDEREADQVADRIMRMPGGAPISSPCSCASGEEMCEECKQKQGAVVARSASGVVQRQPAGPALSMLHRDGGQPLDSSTRAFFEPRFGHDFSNVRLHTSGQAAESAHSIHALAYTAGHHIVFAPGQYNPWASDGRLLLGHELTHTIQQGAVKGLGPTTLQPGVRVPNNDFVQRQTTDPKTPDPSAGQKTITLTWADDDVDFYHNTVAAVATAFGLSQASLWQPVHDPTFTFYRKYSIEHPRANAGDKISVTVSLNHWPGRVPEVTDFTMDKSSAPSTGVTGRLNTDLKQMISAPGFTQGTNYAAVRDRINAAPAQERREVLDDSALLTSLRSKMFIWDYSKAAELLGRKAPTGKELINSPVVKAALDAAWRASNIAAGFPNRRENGGHIFMNLITGEISTAKAAQGTDWGSMSLPSPTPPDNTICVGHFHTHPNPEKDFAQECSPGEPESFMADGVPGLVRSAKGTFTCGPERRLHLAGGRGYPGPSGGDAP
jgi:hypothetical protein